MSLEDYGVRLIIALLQDSRCDLWDKITIKRQSHFILLYFLLWYCNFSDEKNTNIIEMRDTACILQDAGTKLAISGLVALLEYTTSAL